MTFVMICGVPGSGKSFLANSLSIEMNCEICEADQFMMEEGRYKFDSSRLKECHEKCFEKFMRSISGKRNVIVSNTFTRRWEREKYIKEAKKAGYDIQVISCISTFENIHDVPVEKMEAMKERFEMPKFEELNINHKESIP